MIRRELWMNSDGIKLYGELYVPIMIDKKKPSLCVCHGIPAEPHNPAERGYAQLAERLCIEGYPTLIFNFRGAGMSEGNLDMKGWVRDLHTVLDHLAAFEETASLKKCLIGFSGGAATSVYAAAHDRRVSAVIACACPATFQFAADTKQILGSIKHFKEIGAIRDSSFPSSIDDWASGWVELESRKWISRISPRPVFLLHGDNDTVVPVAQARELYELAQTPKTLHILNGAGHRLRIEEEAVATILEWLRQL